MFWFSLKKVKTNEKIIEDSEKIVKNAVVVENRKKLFEISVRVCTNRGASWNVFVKDNCNEDVTIMDIYGDFYEWFVNKTESKTYDMDFEDGKKTGFRVLLRKEISSIIFTRREL